MNIPCGRNEARFKEEVVGVGRYKGKREEEEEEEEEVGGYKEFEGGI